ncbi:VENN motif pre-toxin domain-containing protein [Enterobacteriaceae bacterium H18W14]|uniref:VENN motif pre-toxin domain-containing protein n=1 Tax=Dryocola boscaweniae TaxID=2925397 RepID=UPI0022F14525|nr:VENN motif pre-toxin domain-containing protein [Dryocola boscaweniae]MCT4716620.1 VENN motif pre-toxin domain-containing protein [Dryocola boscaweniae]
MEKVAAHVVANAVLATMQGQNALAGAAGAATGELAGMIALDMYDRPLSELSETEKQTISTLATIAAGIAGGLAGDSTSSALAGAQGGKTTVENNNLASVLAAAEANKSGAAEKWQEQQQTAIKEACSGGTPVSCEMAMAGVGTVLSGGILPKAMVISGAISAGAVGAIDYGLTGTVDPKNVIGAYWAGTLTRYTGFKSTVLINAGNGAIVNSIDGKDPFLYGTIGGLGGAIGYGIGNKVIAPMLDDVINPTWKTLHWDDIGLGISQPSRLSPVPGIVGTAGGGTAGEVFNVVADPSSPVNTKSGVAK